MQNMFDLCEMMTVKPIHFHSFYDHSLHIEFPMCSHVCFTIAEEITMEPHFVAVSNLEWRGEAPFISQRRDSVATIRDPHML